MSTAEDRSQWIEAGLYEPSAPNAGERLALLEWIAGHGVTLAQMREACAQHQLMAVVGDLKLRPGMRMSLDAAARAAGMSPDHVREIRRASGFTDPAPDDAVYTDSDVAMLQTFAVAAQFFSSDELLHFVRVVGSALRRIAEAASEMFMRDVEADLHAKGTELEQAQANLAAVELVESATSLFDPMFRAHLETATQSSRRARADTDDYATVPLSVGFVDLNGFTERTGTLPADEVLKLVIRFEATAVDLVSEHGGRLVKLIGDEVMFSTVEPDESCAIATGLIAQAGEWGSDARGGIAYGSVITSGGDIYGDVVNLASRIVDIAVRSEVLVNEAVVERAARARFEPAGRRALKGFADPVRLWSLQAP